MLLRVARSTGICNGRRALHQAELEELYQFECHDRGWIPRKWAAVGRELARLPGVRRTKPWLNGQRITVYTIAPTDGDVVDLAAARRRA